MKISNVKILYKILSCFVLLALVVAGAIWYTASHMKSIDEEYSKIIDRDVVVLEATLRFQGEIYNFARLGYRIMSETDPADLKTTVEEAEVNRKRMLGYVEEAKNLSAEAGARMEGLFNEIEKIRREEFSSIEKAVLANNREAAVQASKAMSSKTAEVRTQIRAMTAELEKAMKDISAYETQETANTILITIGAITGALVIVMGLAFAVVQVSITSPISGVVIELKKLASGDFNVSLPWADRTDEIGQIAQAAESVVQRVGSTIANVKVAASEVTGASAEISSATTDLSQRTEEQAASLEETSAAMEEMTATVKKNAENAQQASQLANSTREVADRGGHVVSKTVEAMARIEESSRKISDIIGVIDEIARQTNLLALNAAVEAARAGEAGRGFAVVASEVRSLAQRSSQAAKDIKDLITNSNGQVKDGVELVNKAGEALNEIVDSIKKVSEVVSDIANASIEQSTGIDQINKALAQMDEVTQQNSALVEENAATAKTLEQQSKSMDDRVAFFRLRGGAGNEAMPADREAMASSADDHEPAAAPKVSVITPKRTAAAPKRTVSRANGRGPVGQMQAALATAVKQDPDWQEF